jgi:hypothetical protein
MGGLRGMQSPFGMIGGLLGGLLGRSLMGRGGMGGMRMGGMGMGSFGSLGMLGGMFGLAGAPGGMLNGRGMSPRGLSGGGFGGQLGGMFGGMLGGALGSAFSGISGSIINNASRELDPSRRRRVGDSTVVNNNEAPRGSTPSMGSSSALPSAVPLGQFAEALGRGIAGALVEGIGSHSMSVHRNSRSRGWN